MRIGRLAQITGASPRSLRHYESAGLIRSHRLANGYRDYEEDQVRQVALIRDLLAAGLALDAIAVVAPCHDIDGIAPRCEVASARIDAEIAKLDQRAAELALARSRLRALRK
ncbi:MerR family transcriptional regulator [Paenarthrobacter nicotinovorans]|uniref:MerR family transcriptional regulator n=1 Tax=Paenarthrobacter nicotinovorans TaxID=29320 RepID=UPI001C92EA5C|nr:MerR family transcriptional regulator [Paenarthrobacter nicotinovorans]